MDTEKTKTMVRRLRVHSGEKAFNPDMLRLARDYHQCSRKHLAGLIEVSPGFITQIEDGSKQPSDATVEKIVQKLDFPRSFFFQSGRFEGAPTSLFRRRVTIPKSVLGRCTAQLAIAKKAIEKLLEEIEAPDHSLPRLTPDEVKGGVSEVARIVRRALRIPPGPIRSMVEILEDAGVLVVPFDFGTHKIDGCSDWVAGHPVIFYNPSCARSRLRHTLSHELGHLVMHTLIADDDCEDEADAFAGEFNMPADEIRSQFLPLTIKRLAALKAHWKSSMAAILYRAKVLGIATGYRYRTLCIQLREMSNHLEEPNEDLVPFERPRSLAEMIEVYRNELGYKDQDIWDHLQLSERVAAHILSHGFMLRAV